MMQHISYSFFYFILQNSDIYIPRNMATQEGRGYAFVRFLNKADSEDAQRGMDGQIMDGRELRIAEGDKQLLSGINL
jgi:RNA recognition motif-containing protein